MDQIDEKYSGIWSFSLVLTIILTVLSFSSIGDKTVGQYLFQ